MKRHTPQLGGAVGVAVVVTVDRIRDVALGPRERAPTVVVDVTAFAGGGTSCEPRKSHDFKFVAAQNPAGTAPFNFALPLNESSVSDDGKDGGKAV